MELKDVQVRDDHTLWLVDPYFKVYSNSLNLSGSYVQDS